MDQDAAPVRPTTGWLLRELDLQLEAAADALSRDEPAHDLARSSVTRARDALARLRGEQEIDDDGAAVELDAAALALVRRIELAPDRTSARRARAFTVQTCDRWALPASVRNAAVDIASELVANAAAHGRGPVVLALERGAGNLLVRVWDDGPARRGSCRTVPA